MNQRLNMLRQLLAAFIVIAAIGGLSSCEKYSYMPEVINPVDSVHFQAEIQPYLMQMYFMSWCNQSS